MNFKEWIITEDKSQDLAFRDEAAKIANAFIRHINIKSKKEYWMDNSLPYSYGFGISLAEISPEHPNLHVKFVNQIGFGKNKSLGTIHRKPDFKNIPYHY